MSVTIEMLLDEPILVMVGDEDFHIETEGIGAVEKVLSTLDQQREPVFFIMDLTAAHFTLDDHIVGATMVTRQFALFQHPNLREGIIVTTSQAMTLAAKGLNSATFGHIRLNVFKTLDAALEYAREAAQ